MSCAVRMERPINYFAGVFKGNVWVWLLLLIGLITRLPFLSVSLDEVDSGNFYNALKHVVNMNLERLLVASRRLGYRKAFF